MHRARAEGGQRVLNNISSVDCEVGEIDTAVYVDNRAVLLLRPCKRGLRPQYGRVPVLPNDRNVLTPCEGCLQCCGEGMDPAGYRYGLDRLKRPGAGTRGIIIRLNHHPFYNIPCKLIYYIIFKKNTWFEGDSFC